MAFEVMNISLLQLPNNKYIHIVYISIIASLLLGAALAPSLLQAAAQEAGEAKLEVLCNNYGEGVTISRAGRSESISFREWLAIENPDLLDLFNQVGCVGISAAVTGGEIFGSGFQTSVRVGREIEVIGDCGDGEDNTIVRIQSDSFERIYTGIIDGAGPSELTGLTYLNCTPGRIHAIFRQLQNFEEVTIADRTALQ